MPRTRTARCSPLSEGWSGTLKWRGEGNDDGKGIGGVDEIVVVDGTHVGGKIAGGYLVRRCSTDEATTKDEV